jgi:hypothetical protein
MQGQNPRGRAPVADQNHVLSFAAHRDEKIT